MILVDTNILLRLDQPADPPRRPALDDAAAFGSRKSIQFAAIVSTISSRMRPCRLSPA